MGISIETEAKAAAAEFREAHHLGLLPLGDLATLIEDTTGIDVAILEAPVDEHGLLARDPLHNTAIIGVARTPHVMRQRSTLAHELAHLLFDDRELSTSGRPPEERRADAFARHLLLPLDGLAAFLGAPLPASEETLSRVVQRFLVSPAIAAIVLRQAGYISAETAEQWKPISTKRLAAKFGWLDFYKTLQHAANQARPPQKLLTRALRGYELGVVSQQTIATLLGVSLADTKTYLEDAGITQAVIDTESYRQNELPDIEIDLSDLDTLAEDS